MKHVPKIGVIGLMFDEYHKSYPELKRTRTEFMEALLKKLDSIADVEFSEIADTREKVEDQVHVFERSPCDGILLVFLTYTPSLVVFPALLRTKLPIVIWNTQTASCMPVDALDSEIIDNHGVHGVQDLANVLNRGGKPFLVVTGHFEDNSTMLKLESAMRAARAVSALRKARIGLFGHPMQDMGDFNLDETAFLAQIGPSVRHIQIDELADYIDAVPDEVLRQAVAEDRRRFVWDLSITDEECEMAIRMELALRKLIVDYRLDGWAQHFVSLGMHSRIRMLPFLAASKLMSEGIGYGAEGDVAVVAAFLLVRELVGEAGFSEMFCMDFDDESVLIRHMGEGNMAFARDGSQIRIVRNRFGMVDVLPVPSPVYSSRPGDATLVSLAVGRGGRFRLVYAEGEVTEFPGRNTAVSPESKWRPKSSLPKFLDDYAYAGGSHHQSLGYGHFGDSVEEAARLMGVEVIRVC
jgi:L-arabinose isomerase